MKRNLKIVLIKEVDFMRAWIKLLEHCIRNENLIPFGSKDDPKAIRGEVCSRVVLEQSAVKQCYIQSLLTLSRWNNSSISVGVFPSREQCSKLLYSLFQVLILNSKSLTFLKIFLS